MFLQLILLGLPALVAAATFKNKLTLEATTLCKARAANTILVGFSKSFAVYQVSPTAFTKQVEVNTPDAEEVLAMVTKGADTYVFTKGSNFHSTALKYTGTLTAASVPVATTDIPAVVSGAAIEGQWLQVTSDKGLFQVKDTLAEFTSITSFRDAVGIATISPNLYVVQPSQYSSFTLESTGVRGASGSSVAVGATGGAGRAGAALVIGGLDAVHVCEAQCRSIAVPAMGAAKALALAQPAAVAVLTADALGLVDLDFTPEGGQDGDDGGQGGDGGGQGGAPGVGGGVACPSGTCSGTYNGPISLGAETLTLGTDTFTIEGDFSMSPQSTLAAAAVPATFAAPSLQVNGKAQLAGGLRMDVNTQGKRSVRSVAKRQVATGQQLVIVDSTQPIGGEFDNVDIVVDGQTVNPRCYQRSNDRVGAGGRYSVIFDFDGCADVNAGVVTPNEKEDGDPSLVIIAIVVVVVVACIVFIIMFIHMAKKKNEEKQILDKLQDRLMYNATKVTDTMESGQSEQTKQTKQTRKSTLTSALDESGATVV